MLKDKNLLAKIVVIYAAIEAVISLILGIWGNVSLITAFGGFDEYSYFASLAGNSPTLMIFSWIIQVVNLLFAAAVTFIWIYYLVRQLGDLRLPVIVTFAYYVSKLIQQVFYYLSKLSIHEIPEFFKRNIWIMVIAAAWFILIISLNDIHKKVFASIRLGVLVINFFGNVWYFYSFVIRNASSWTRSEWITLGSYIFTFINQFVVGCLVLWILIPGLFDAKDDSTASGSPE
ncbi:MAG: hypothetical protein K5871_01490 [Lachnospiraceae bacterium]|nr:hypothetical protein [Lachnospiraceae bacterium]